MSHLTTIASQSLVLIGALLLSGAAGAQQLALLGVQQDGPATVTVDVAPPPVDKEIEDLVALARSTRSSATEWTPGQSLSDGRNAHSTNTKDHMKEALEGGYNWFEGDIREEINAPHEMEARHDEGQESGNNLLLKQWLTVGVASGRGLKLDVKEPQHMARILDLVAASGVDEGRVMFNLGFGAMAEWGARIRARFPKAWLAVNPPQGDSALTAEDAQAMVAQGRQFGGPVTHVVRFDLLNKASLAILKTGGPVSVWNSQFGGKTVKDAEALTRSLKANGVDGIVDIRKSGNTWDRVELAADWARNKTKEGVGKVVDAASSLIHKIPGL